MTLDDYAFSDDMKYRYEFSRRWADTAGPDQREVVWVLLNPGTGDTEERYRPTLGRCIKWSQSWGFAVLTIINLFAYRATKPRDLYTADDPIGPKNDETIRRVTARASRIIVAWGSHGRFLDRGRRVAQLLREPFCLGLTKKGQPRHPLLLPEDSQLVPYRVDG